MYVCMYAYIYIYIYIYIYYHTYFAWNVRVRGRDARHARGSGEQQDDGPEEYVLAVNFHTKNCRTKNL